MACIEYAREREVAVLSDDTSGRTVGVQDRGIAGSMEAGAKGRVDGKRDLLATYPVALIVPITVDECDLDIAVEEPSESFEVPATDEISGCCETVTDGGGEAGKVEWYTEGCLDFCRVQKPCSIFGRKRVG